MHVETFRIGEGAYELEVTMVDTGRGVTATVTSAATGCGHVGATAQAIPRPEEGRTATVSLLAVPCHRDDVPAHDIAASVATALRVPAAVTCGIHIDDASAEDIRLLMEAAHAAADAIVECVRRAR